MQKLTLPYDQKMASEANISRSTNQLISALVGLYTTQCTLQNEFRTRKIDRVVVEKIALKVKF